MLCSTEELQHFGSPFSWEPKVALDQTALGLAEDLKVQASASGNITSSCPGLSESTGSVQSLAKGCSINDMKRP